MVKIKELQDNINKLIKVFDNHNTSFEQTDLVYNTITKKILPDNYAKLFLNHEEGEKPLNLFIAERLEHDVSIWEPSQKTKL